MRLFINLTIVLFYSFTSLHADELTFTDINDQESYDQIKEFNMDKFDSLVITDSIATEADQEELLTDEDVRKYKLSESASRTSYREFRRKHMNYTPQQYWDERNIFKLWKKRYPNNRRPYKYHLFHKLTLECMKDQLTGKHNADHDSEACINAVK